MRIIPIIFLYGLIFDWSGVFAQNPNSINLSSPDNGQKLYAAQELVKLSPGYTYTAGSTSMRAYIEKHTPYQSLHSSSTFNSTMVNTSLEVGSIPGQHGVSANGSAEYYVNLRLPEGTNGMLPKLGISYSSAAGNGILGMGWELSGLSSISVVPQNYYQDNGKTENIQLDGLDQFALDGNRLVSTSGIYGYNGTRYATEAETFSRITSYGGSVGPDWFSVETKEGLVMEYGRTEDSRIKNANAGATVIIWRLSKVYDTYGNYMEFAYRNENNDSRIDRISYTGNSNSNVAPYNHIKFHYETRNDKNSIYIAGTELKNNYLLSKITISSDGEIYKEYQFAYGENHYAFLKSIGETGADGSSLNGTIFKYDDKGLAYQMISCSSFTSLGSMDFEAAKDFNGDGISDLLGKHFSYVNGIKVYSSWEAFTSNGLNTFSHYANGSIPAGYYMHFDHKKDDFPLGGMSTTFDFYGDGSDDILLIGQSGSSGAFTLNGITIIDINGLDQTTSYPVSISTGGYMDPAKSIHIGDYDGDGKDDLLILKYNSPSSPTYFGKIITSWGAEQAVNITGLQYLNASYQIYPSDFDGDGKKELMVLYANSCEIFEFENVSGVLNERKIYHSGNPGFPTRYHTIIPGDFNGDGKTDILTSANNTNWTIGYSTGTSFIEKPFTFQSYLDYTSSSHGISIGDFNGDGKSDILHSFSVWVGSTSTSSKLDVYHSKGDGFVFSTHPTELITSYDDFVLGDFNGDGKTDVFNKDFYSSPVKMYYFNRDGKDFLLHKVKNGSGQEMSYTHSWLSKPTNYTAGTVLGVPIVEFRLSLPVVVAMIEPNGIGGQKTINYFYQGAKFHKGGRGFLGFQKLTVEDNTSGFRTITENQIASLNFVQHSLLRKKEQMLLIYGNQLISEKVYTSSLVGLGGLRYKVQTSSLVENNLLNTTSSTTTFGYDAYGNVISRSTSNGVENISEANTYAVFGSWWIPSRVTVNTVTSTRTGQTAYVRSKNFAYNTSGSLSQEISDQGTPKAVTETYLYDAFGNKRQTTRSASGLTSSVSKLQYDDKGRFAILATNPLNQSMTTVYGKKWGQPLSVTDVTGQTAVFTYNGFGRLLTATDPKGITTTYSKIWSIATNSVSPTVPTNTMFYTIEDKPGNSHKKIWYDVFGREVKSETEGLNDLIYIVQNYNAKGNMVSKTEPFYVGDSPVVTTSSYDNYNRVTHVTNGESFQTFSYSAVGGNQTIQVTDFVGTETSIIDAAGKVTSSEDEGGTLNFVYFSSGKQKQVSAGGTVLVKMEYDLTGNQTSLIDNNSGTYTYEYDAYNRLISQTDGNGHQYTLQYDIINRVVNKTGPEGITSTTYVTAGNGLNEILKVTSPNGVYTEFSYDQYGRVITEKEMIDANLYITTFDYNSYDQILLITYPSGFKVRQFYDVNGHLTSVRDVSATTSFFTASSHNAQGNYTGYVLGDGKTTTKIYDNYGFMSSINATGVQDYHTLFDHSTGNLMRRWDPTKNRAEDFEYDANRRLVSSEVYFISNGLTFSPEEMEYAGNGNITSKTGLGQYTYDPDKINAVTEVENPYEIITSLQQDITYTPFDRTATISEGDHFLQFTYGPDLNRVKSELSISGVSNLTKHYVNSFYEKEITPLGTKEIHRIPTGEGSQAVYVIDNTGGGTGGYFYLYKDHIGSVVAVTNASGAVVAQQNFDPWGRRRNATSWAYETGITLPASYNWVRGFTGHEHHDEFSLVNMNNRMYDPILGRMLAVDNFIQSPFNTQSYNRYSYVMNNPLGYIDPTGEIAWVPVIIGAAIGAYVGGSAANGTYNPADWDYTSGRTWLSMLGGAVVGGVSGGLGSTVASSGMVMANTAAVIAGSFVNSVGMNIVTNGATDVSVSFGVASYNMSSGNFGYLGKKGNSTLDNIGYGVGALANIADILVGVNPGGVKLRTENYPGSSKKDLIGHSQLTTTADVSVVDWGPDARIQKYVDWVPGTNSYENGHVIPASKMKWEAILIDGVNVDRISSWSPTGRYNIFLNSCVSQTSRALNLSGAFNIGIHPYLLHAQMYLRSVGVRPILFSSSLHQY